MAEFASKGVAGTALGLGAGALGIEVLRNGIGGILGNGNGYCHESTPVNRYEAQMSERIAELETEVKLRDANTFTMGELGKFRDYMEGRFERIEKELCDQKVYNATLNGAVGCIQGQVAALQNLIQGLTSVVVKSEKICPTPMPLYNSWVAPTAEAPAAG